MAYAPMASDCLDVHLHFDTKGAVEMSRADDLHLYVSR